MIRINRLHPQALAGCLILLLAGLIPLGCGSSDEPGAQAEAGEVIVYTALDQIYSEPILAEFERQTGIRARAVYDSEGLKTVGLVSRLLAERDRPRCDVFWNNELIHTLRLEREGLLEPYVSPAAESIPATFKAADGAWTGFAARARVIAWNTNLVDEADVPRSIDELADPRWQGRFAIAYPLFGTTATHGAVLFAEWGEQRAREYFEALKANGAVIAEGNMSACRMVAAGEIALCLTDTDDVYLLRGQGLPVDGRLIGHGGEGALLIPNSVALMRGAPNAENGRRLIDFLLRPETEAALANMPSKQIPLHPAVEGVPEDVRELGAAPYWEIDYPAAAAAFEASARFLGGLFARP